MNDLLFEKLKNEFSFLNIDLLKTNLNNYRPIDYYNSANITTNLNAEISKIIRKKINTSNKKATLSSENINVPDEYNNLPELNKIFAEYNVSNNIKNFIITELSMQKNNYIKDNTKSFEAITEIPSNCKICNSDIIISFKNINKTDYEIECVANKNHQNN
jgi:hypothetical protein